MMLLEVAQLLADYASPTVLQGMLYSLQQVDRHEDPKCSCFLDAPVMLSSPACPSSDRGGSPLAVAAGARGL